MLLYSLLLVSAVFCAEPTCKDGANVGNPVTDYPGTSQVDRNIGTEVFDSPVFSGPGYVRAWEVYISKPGVPVYVSVLRYEYGLQYLVKVGTTKIVGETAGPLTVTLQESDYIPVQKNYLIGLHYDSGTSGVIPVARSDDEKCGTTDNQCLDYVTTSLILTSFTNEDWDKQTKRLDVFKQERFNLHGSAAIKAIVCQGELVRLTTPAPVPESQCALPFEYQGQKFSTCINVGSDYPWCSLTAVYGNQYKECKAEDGDPIPENMPCHPSFLYKGHTHSACIVDQSDAAWCAVEAEYNSQNWRECRPGDPLPEHKPCHFPFLYNGKKYSECISDQGKAWCSTGAVYSASNWRYCRNVGLVNLNMQVSNAEKAEQLCAQYKMSLASRRDILEAWELGNESCFCGWVKEGKRVSYLRDVEQCELVQQVMLKSLGQNNGELKAGVNECSQGEAGALCVTY